LVFRPLFGSELAFVGAVRQITNRSRVGASNCRFAMAWRLGASRQPATVSASDSNKGAEVAALMAALYAAGPDNSMRMCVSASCRSEGHQSGYRQDLTPRGGNSPLMGLFHTRFAPVMRQNAELQTDPLWIASKTTSNRRSS
jgi:hypothetical protein